MLVNEIMKSIKEYEKALDLLQDYNNIDNIDNLDWKVVNKTYQDFLNKAKMIFFNDNKKEVRGLAIQLLQKELQQIQIWKEDSLKHGN